MRKPVLICVLAGFGLAAALVAWWRLSPGESANRRVVSALAQQASTRAYAESEAASSVGSAVSRAFDRSRNRLSVGAGFSPTDVEALAARSSELVDLYRQGTIEQFNTWLGQFSQQSHESIWNGKDPEEEWARLTATVRKAPFDSNGVEVRVRAHEGKIGQMPSHSSAFLRSRKALEPELDPLQHPVTAIEVVIPMEMTNTAGGTFDGYLGVMFVKRPADGEWVAHQVAIYDVPEGTPIPILPL